MTRKVVGAGRPEGAGRGRLGVDGTGGREQGARVGGGVQWGQGYGVAEVPSGGGGRWPAGGQALPGVGMVWQMYSVGMVGGVGDRGRGVSGRVMGMVWQGKGSDWGGVGGVFSVTGMGRGSGGESQWAAK